MPNMSFSCSGQGIFLDYMLLEVSSSWCTHRCALTDTSISVWMMLGIQQTTWIMSFHQLTACKYMLSRTTPPTFQWVVFEAHDTLKCSWNSADLNSQGGITLSSMAVSWIQTQLTLLAPKYEVGYECTNAHRIVGQDIDRESLCLRIYELAVPQEVKHVSCQITHVRSRACRASVRAMLRRIWPPRASTSQLIM